MPARLLIPLLVFATTAPALGESYAVRLGGRTLGSLESTPTVLSTRLDNTPLGVGDGGFEARLSGPVYTSASSRKDRRIRVVLDGGSVQETSVIPASEATYLSVPANVPPGVIDPVTALSRVLGAGDCPAPLRFYDGRRVVEVGTTARIGTAETLTCHMAYRVVAGPGHLSPFGFSRIDVTAVYDVSGGRVTGARDVSLGAGPFTLHLTR